MSMSRKKKYALIGYGRFLTQAAALVLAVAVSFALVRNMGLPRWAFAALVIVAGMFFCGWVCPFGTVQEWLRVAGKRFTGVTLRIPERVDRYLLLARYVLLVLGGVLALSALNARHTFVAVATGTAAEAAAYAILAGILALSLFVDRPFCKYLCGFGAVSGLTSVFRVFTVKRDGDRCVGCRQCDRSCMMGVEVSKAHNVRDPHCINCGKCAARCPVPGALEPGFALPCLADAKVLKTKYLG